MLRYSKSTIVLVTAFSFSAGVQADSIKIDDVIVTATRFSNTDPRIPASVSILTREDIENPPAINIPDVLKTQSGVNVTPLYGNEGIDAPVDIRGFGDAGVSNTLILLDGQRLNTVDMSSIQWATVPLHALERIEIIRGGGSVLYGDRASGGVINLITEKSGRPLASATATLGSYGYKGLDGFVSGGTGQGYFNAFVHASDSDGWRQNSQSRQLSLAGRGGLIWGTAGETFIDYAVYRSDYGLPGSIASRTYHSDPQRARTPKDTQEKEGYRLRPGISVELSDTITLDAELAFAGEDQHSDNVSFASLYDRSLRTVSFTPRIHWRHGLGQLQSETTAGLDYYRGRITSESSTFAAQGARQISRALYLQNTTALNDQWSVTLGGRSQNMDQQAHQDAYPAFFMPAFTGSSSRTRSVYDLGLHYRAPTWSMYGKTGTSFRFANTDELFAYDPFTGNPVFGGDIKPQRGRNNEIGGNFTIGKVTGQLALYRISVKDEIGYDGASFANVNFDPTRHQGGEADLSWKITEQWHARLAYAHTDATFRSGAYGGKQIPMVPTNKATAQLGWHDSTMGHYTAQLNYVGERYVSGDYSNVLKQLPAYATVDLRASWDFKPIQVTATALNLLDKRYAPYGLYSTHHADYFYFPADARSIFVSARYDFR